MKKILIVAALAAALSGCASLNADIAKFQQIYSVATTASVDPSIAQVTVSSFQVIEAASTEYFKYCRVSPAASVCNAGTKTSPGPLRLAIKYIRQGRSSRDQIKAAGKSGALISSTAYNLLVDAISNLNSNTPIANFGAAK